MKIFDLEQQWLDKLDMFTEAQEGDIRLRLKRMANIFRYCLKQANESLEETGTLDPVLEERRAFIMMEITDLLNELI